MKHMADAIAIIGDTESIKGFCAIGIDIYPCDELTNASAILRKIADGENYAVIFLTEEFYNSTEKERDRYSQKLIPAIIPVPGIKSNLGISKKRLSGFVQQAVGSDIIFND